ncbi:MAG: sialidase, partial [Gemmatimonadota bacterium]|nr:sialidase [Gemmatimonadota bacterium]
RHAPDEARLAVMVPPGTYTVTLSTGGQEMKQTVEVRKDPESGGSEAGIQAQTALLLGIRDDMNAVVDLVNGIEKIRAQLVSFRAMLGNDAARAAARTAADSLEKKFIAVEENLLQLKLTGRGQDDVRYPMMLLNKLGYLANGVSAAEFAPTTQQAEVAAKLRADAQAAKAQYDGLVAKDLPAFNAMLQQQGLAGIIAR